MIISDIVIVFTHDTSKKNSKLLYSPLMVLSHTANTFAKFLICCFLSNSSNSRCHHFTRRRSSHH